MKLTDAVSLLDYLASSYANFNPTEKTAAAWAITLADQDAAAILDAAARYVRSGSAFPPNPGQLLQLAKNAGERKRGSDAWEEVRNAMALHSYMADPRFKDEKITRCIRALGGWYNLSTQETDAVASNRARFIEHYDNLADREELIDNRLDTAASMRMIEDATFDILGGGVKRLYGEGYRDQEEIDD